MMNSSAEAFPALCDRVQEENDGGGAISTGRAWALVGLAIFIELAAVWALGFGRHLVSRRGIPVWVLGVLLVRFSFWLAWRGIKRLRA